MSSGVSYLPNKDADLAAWLDNFNTVAAANQAALPLTILEIGDSSTATGDFEGGLAAVQAAHAAAKAATINKDGKRKIAVALARALVKKIQAVSTVPAALKTQLGITVTGGHHPPVPLYAPSNAVAKILAGGIIQLVWNVNGNASGAVYIIESSDNATTGFAMVNAQTASKFLDGSVSAGTPQFYRIKATRNTRVSAYSNVAVVSAS